MSYIGDIRRCSWWNRVGDILTTFPLYGWFGLEKKHREKKEEKKSQNTSAITSPQDLECINLEVPLCETVN